MKVILITPPDIIKNESSLINRMFENGLSLLHLRKPGLDFSEMSKYLNNIPQKYHSSIVTHSFYDLLDDYNLRGIHIADAAGMEIQSIMNRYKRQSNLSISISCHALEDIHRCSHGLDYVFLSPVFDSISKRNYKSRFAPDELSASIKRSPVDVIALGGCTAQNLMEIKKLGFSGAAFLGAVWNSPDPVDSIISINKKAGRL